MDDTYLNFLENFNLSIREEPALKILSVDLPENIITEVNNYIDNVATPNNKDYSHHLAGQLNQNENLHN